MPADEAWQVAREQLAAEVDDGSGTPRRPWITLIVGEQTGLALGTDMQLKRPTAADVLKAIGQAIKKPAIGRPYRPERVVCAERELADELAPGLAALGVECVAGDTPQLAEVLASLGQFLEARQPVPGLLESPGVTPELVGRLFGAAAAFFRLAPWRLLPPDTPIAVRVPDLGNRLAYVIVIGQASEAYGLAIFRTPEALQIGLSDLEPEQMVELADQEGLTYGPREEMPEVDLAAIEAHGWEVAGPDAYPIPIIASRTGQFRRPTAADLEWYETVLWTLPHYIEEHLAPALAIGEGVEATMRARLGEREFVAEYRFPPAIKRRMGRRKRP